ncbi:MAG: ribosome silencing factor [Alphaproteobacteria bacterium]|nr:ribosome silencing factor [Alphaproteobacteria bacterium SS10]
MTIANARQISASDTTATDLPEPEELERLAIQSLEDDKAFDVVSIDLSGKSAIADAMIIASGTSSRQVSAMAEHLLERLKKAGVGSVKVEGKATADWVLIDAGDIVVHLFRPEVREFYNIEKMWLLDGPSGSVGGGAAVSLAGAQ